MDESEVYGAARDRRQLGFSFYDGGFSSVIIWRFIVMVKWDVIKGILRYFYNAFVGGGRPI